MTSSKSQNKLSSVFVTGTDTEIGKTVVTGLLGRYLLEKGYNVITQKWIQSGSESFSEDIDTHLKLMGLKRNQPAAEKAEVCPYVFKFPASAHLAANLEKKKINAEKIKKSFRDLSGKFDCVLAEGLGGALVPYNSKKTVIDIAAELKLKHLVITSVTRDDLNDGGASMFARCIEAARKYNPGCPVEVLIPDFRGDDVALATVVAAKPDVLNHNLETVPRLYPYARPKADYQRSLMLLQNAKELEQDMLTKSGLIVGLGETVEELLETMHDLRRSNCDILTIGQYLSPSLHHLPIARYYSPEEFKEFAKKGAEMGFRHVESGPLVRSSYHARQHVNGIRNSELIFLIRIPHSGGVS